MEILKKNPLCFELHRRYIEHQERMDVYFFLPKFIEYESKLKECKFPLVSLGDKKISIKITDGTHYTPKYVDLGIPFIMVTNVTEEGINFKDVKYISIEEHKKLIKRCKPEPGDILLRKVGVGPRIAKTILKNTPQFSIFVSLALLKINKNNVIPEYLETFLNTPLGRMQTIRFNKGIGQPDLHIESIRQVLVPLPPKTIQEEIVEIMEQARSKRKQNLKEVKGLKKELDYFCLKELDLAYPEEKEEKMFITELDERLDPYYYHPRFKRTMDSLKRGKFELKKLKEIVEFSNEQIDPKKEPNRLFKYIQIQNIDEVNHKISSYTSVLGKDAPGRAKMLIKKGDILLPFLGGSLKSIAIVPKEFDNEVATNGFAILRISDKNLRYYVFHYLITKFAQMQIERQLTGAIMSSISKSGLGNLLIPLLHPTTQERIAKKILEVNTMIEKLQKEVDDVINKAKQKVEKIIIG
jgi:restriction endonuclease S subunit